MGTENQSEVLNMKRIKRMELFGDSILRGVIYSAEEGRYGLSRDCRYRLIAEQGIEVLNHCKMGATIERGLDVLKSRLAHCDEGTLVLLEYGGNDCAYDWQRVSDDPCGVHLPVTPEEAFLKHYGEAISYARSKGASVALSSLAPISAEKYMKWISRGKSYENILNWLGDVGHLSRWQEYYSRLVERLAKETGCPVFDLRSAFLCEDRFPELICEDGIHPTQKGHDIVARELCAFAAAV